MTKRVFVLGAGFSKDVAGYPLAGNLAPQVLAEWRAGDPTSDAFFRDVPPAMHYDIELLMTYLSEDLPWGGPRDSSQRMAWYHGIVETLVTRFQHLEENQGTRESSPGGHAAAKKLVQSLDADDTIITFNYDTLIERLWREDAHEALDDDLYPIPIVPIEDRVPSSVGLSWDSSRGGTAYTFKLLKLHGSIHWLVPRHRQPGDERLFWRPHKIHPMALKENLEKLQVDLEPFVIPPALAKARFYNHGAVRTQWRMAREALHQATEVYVVGYSLPWADLSSQMLLRETLDTNRVRRLAIATREGPDLELLKRRFSQVVSGPPSELEKLQTDGFVVAQEGESSVDKLLRQCPHLLH